MGASPRFAPRGREVTDLFEAAAERIAYEGERNVAQVRSELKYGVPAPAGGIFQPAKGDVVTAQRCDSCDAIFAAKPRTPAVCNLCRRVPA